jgi:hypothetical protein
MHFEVIWNEAESIAKSYTDLDRKQISRKAISSLQDLLDYDNTPETLHKSIGDLLFELCSLCAYYEEKSKIEINVATALIDTIQHKRAEILDNPPQKDIYGKS